MGSLFNLQIIRWNSPIFEDTTKKFQLEIHIDEGEGREWEILYNELSVQNF